MPHQLYFFFLLLFPLSWSLELSYSVLTSLGGACPPKDTCSTLADPREDHLWGGRTCECGPHCGTRATCCIDANGRVHSGDSKDFEACRGVTGGFSAWMVDKCPNGDDSHFQERCGDPLGTNQDPLMSAPVTSKTSGRTYRNYFCALCHQDAETAVVWGISLQGLTPQQANQTTSVLLEQLVFDPMQESWGLMVYRNRTRITKIEKFPADTKDHSVDKVSPSSYSEENRSDGGIEPPLQLTVPAEHVPKKSEDFDGYNGEEISQKNVELNLFNEEAGRGDFIQQESINAEENIKEFSFTRYNQKPPNSETFYHESVDVRPSYSTQFRLSYRAGNQEKADGRNFKTKESNKPFSSGSMGDYTFRTLNPKKAGQTPKDQSQSKELSQMFNLNPTMNYQKFYSPPIVSGISDQTPFIRLKRDELRSVQSHSAEITKTKGNIQPPTNPPTFQKVNIKFSVPIGLRQWATKCYTNMIHSCPDSYPDQDIRDACASYYAPVRLRVAGTRLAKFRNIHCGLCNNATSYEGSCVLEQARKKSKFNFSMLLDVNRDEGGQGGSCEKGQVFDPFFKKCRTLKCGRPNFIVKDKKCVKA